LALAGEVDAQGLPEEGGVFFEGVSGESSDEEIAAIAPKHPVFALT